MDGFEQLGSYHYIFWNCQLYAKLLLQLICESPSTVDFDAVTSATAARLVSFSVQAITNVQALCALVVPSPISTTKWVEEKKRSKKLIEDFKASAADPDTPLSDLSVNYITYSSLTEAQNAAEIKSQLGEQKEGTNHLIQ